MISQNKNKKAKTKKIPFIDFMFYAAKEHSYSIMSVCLESKVCKWMLYFIECDILNNSRHKLTDLLLLLRKYMVLFNITQRYRGKFNKIAFTKFIKFESYCRTYVHLKFYQSYSVQRALKCLELGFSINFQWKIVDAAL